MANGDLLFGCTGDSHFDEHGDLDSNVRVHHSMLDAMAERGVNVLLHAGDIHHKLSSPAVRNAVADFLQRATSHFPVVLVRGNHDPLGDLDIYRKLQTVHPLHVVDRARWVELDLEVAGARRLVDVCCLPWFDKAGIVAGLQDASIEFSNEATIAAARQMLSVLDAHESVPGAVRVGVGHPLIGGSQVSTGQTLLGQSVELSPADLDRMRCVFWSLGHIHKHQEWNDGAQGYSGSPDRHNYGEPEEKGWRLLTVRPNAEAFAGGDLLPPEFVTLPARRLVLAELDWTTPEAIALLTAGDMAELVRGIDAHDLARVRVRYTIAEEHAGLVSKGAIAALLLNSGAEEVKLDPVTVRTQRVRSGEISKASSTWDQLLVWLRSVEADPDAMDPAELARLEALVAEIDQAADTVAAKGDGDIRLCRTRVKNLFDFSDAEIDYEALGEGLVAIVADNGGGKTAMLESTLACLHNVMPSRSAGSTLYDFARGSRDAAIEAELIAGDHRYVARRLIDAKSRASEWHLTKDGEPVVSGKSAPFYAEVDRLFGSKDLMLAGPFAAQSGSGSLLSVPRRQRKALFIELLGLAHLDALATVALERVRMGDKAAEAASGKLSAIRDRAAELEDAPAAHAAAKGGRDRATSSLERSTAARVEWEKKVADTADARGRLDSVREAHGSASSAFDAAAADSKRADDAAKNAQDEAARRLAMAPAMDRAALESSARDRNAGAVERALKTSPEIEDALLDADRIENAVSELDSIDERLQILRGHAEDLAKVENEIGNLEAAVASAEKRAALVGEVPCSASASWVDGADASIDLAGTCPLLADARKAALSINEDQARIAELNARKDAEILPNYSPEDRAAAEVELADARELAGRAPMLKVARAEDARKAEAEARLKRELAEELEQIAKAVEDRDRARSDEAAAARRSIDAAEDLAGEKRRVLASATEKLKEAQDALGAALEAAAGADPVALEREGEVAMANEREAREALDSALGDLAKQEERLVSFERCDAELKEATSILDAANLRVLDWSRVAKGLGPNGAQALLIDAAGPEVSAKTNDLLAAWSHGRFSIEIQTLKEKKGGKGEMSEDFSIRVYDEDEVRLVDDLSGGEKAIVDVAMRLALSILNAERSGVRWRTLWFDETSGPISAARGSQFISMLRRAIDVGGFHNVIFVAHMPAIYEAADVQVRLEEGCVLGGSGNE